MYKKYFIENFLIKNFDRKRILSRNIGKIMHNFPVCCFFLSMVCWELLLRLLPLHSKLTYANIADRVIEGVLLRRHF